MAMCLEDGLSETARAVARRSPQITTDVNANAVAGMHRDAMPRRRPWANSSQYGSWVQKDHDASAAQAHRDDLAMARHYVQFGAVPGATRRATSCPGGSTNPQDWPRVTELNGTPVKDPLGATRQGATRGTLMQTGVFFPGADGAPLSPGEGTYVSREERVQQAFPGHPGASRGMRSGANAKWSFERCPSVMHAPLDRDRGRLGRAVGGATLDASVVQGPVAFDPLPQLGPGTSSSPALSSTLHRLQASQSEGALYGSAQGKAQVSSPRKPLGGMHGMIGMTWNDAKTPAGTCYKGAKGRFIGF